MRVLLLKDVPGLGRVGDIKEVAGGHALNYLIPRKLVAPVTEGVVRQVRTTKEAEERRRERKSTEARDLMNRLEGRTVTFRVRAGEGDRLYGSITGADIAELLTHTVGVEVDRRFVDVEHPIKTLGEHKVTVKVGGGLSATVYVVVERAAEEG